MKREEWQRVKEVFAVALEQPAALRARFVQNACGENDDLRREVESLLAANDESQHIIEKNAFDLASTLNAEAKSFSGKQFGHYRIVREIGRGGMGAVFLAERTDGEFDQQVALKIVRRSFADLEIARRFRRERQILASLNHPNIAKLLDGGVSSDGEPFLVMEYVAGVRIDQFCAREDLTIKRRLKLFLRVCAAVSFAHQNLIVHRDIKPSNIIVTPDGNPKLLDFGIAKLLDREHASERTETNYRAFTPEYASPEQASGAQITTASDVYSLGVLLSNLIEKRGSSVVVCPLQENQTSSNQTPKTNGAKQTTKDNKQRTADELKAIIAMARRAEPERRYASVQQFAEDIERFLDGLPVRAQKDNFRYRARKFAQRNRVAVFAAALIVLILFGSIAVLWRQVSRAERERQRADAVKNFLIKTIFAPNPQTNSLNNQKAEKTVNDVWEDVARRLDAEDLSAEPEVRAELRQAVGTNYFNLGKYDLAEKHLRATIAAQTELFGDDYPDTAVSQIMLAGIFFSRADYAAAEAIYERHLGNLRRWQQNGRVSADILQGALSNRALIKRARGDAEAAEVLLREALALRAQTPAEHRGLIVRLETFLLLILLDRGKFDEAESEARRMVAEFRETNRTDSPEFANPLTVLGSVLMEKGAHREADANLREAETILRKFYASNFTAIYDNVRLQAQNLYFAGDFAAANNKIDSALEHYRQAVKPQHINFATALTVKGLIVYKLGDQAEAEKILREAVALREQNLPPDHFMTALAKGALGEVLAASHKTGEAESLLAESYESLRRSQASENERVRLAKNRLTALLAAKNN